jgi:hypothetical protein
MRFLLTHDFILTFVSRTGSPSSPHGKLSALALILSILGFICSFFATIACSYVHIEGVLYDVPPYGRNNTNGDTYDVGLFRHQDYSFCSFYSSDMIDNASYFDGAFKTARAFAVMSTVCIGIGMICLIVSSRVAFTPKALKFVGFLLGNGSLCGLLTFSLFASSLCDEFTSCQRSTGANFAIASTILALLAAVLTCNIPAKDKETTFEPVPIVAIARAPPEPGTKTVMETIMPDGTKNSTETIVNADGSYTVTKSVIQPEIV